MDEKFLNPFTVDPTEEYMHEPQPVANWVEYCYFYGGDENTDYGVSIHIGGDADDPRIFRGSMAIFLPDGEMLVAMYRGRDGTKYGPGAGPLKVRCIEPMKLWLAEFDGLVHRVHRSAVMNDVFKDSPTEVASFHVLFEAASPLWDLDKAGIARSMVLVQGELSEEQQQAQRAHHWQQVGRSRGEITVRGKRIAIRGGAMRDHTYGPRDYAAINGGGWWNGVFPDGTSFMAMATRVGGNFIKGGFIYRNDGKPLEIIQLLKHPPIGDVDTPANSYIADVLHEKAWSSFSLVLGTKHGEETIEVETRHGIPVTYFSPAYELLGTDFSRTVGGSQMSECPARFCWRGMTGFGMIERIACIAHLKRE
ncbi:MAG: hypothetical protein ABW034_12985 [Steroidobacteraceae bacterium]